VGPSGLEPLTSTMST